MRLSTAQDLSFQDLPYICLPLFAQVEVERYLNGRLSCYEISNLDQFISNKTAHSARDQLDSLISKIGDGWIFLVYLMNGDIPPEALMSLNVNIETEANRKGLEAENWLPHPSLYGLAKFNIELIIQRLTYHERIYGVTDTISDKQAREELWHKEKTDLSQQDSFCELSDLSEGAVQLE